jgi:hypothetical protein
MSAGGVPVAGFLGNKARVVLAPSSAPLVVAEQIVHLSSSR